MRGLQSVVACVAILVATQASALPATQVAFDTLGPSNAYLPGQGWGVGGGSADGPTGANYTTAGQFVSQSSGTLTGVELAISRFQGTPLVTLSLLSDDNGAPGTTLATAEAIVPDTPSLISASFTGAVQLSVQSAYWLSISTNDLAAAHVWYFNAQSVQGRNAFTGALWQAPGEWFLQDWTLGAFRVTVASSVPEAPTTALMLVGALALLLHTRARSAG